MYLAPLRHAVLVLGRKGEPWTVDAMAVLGLAQERKAKAYANQLASQFILVSRPDGLYQVGKGFRAWELLRPKTKPGGNRTINYKAIPANAV